MASLLCYGCEVALTIEGKGALSPPKIKNFTKRVVRKKARQLRPARVESNGVSLFRFGLQVMVRAFVVLSVDRR
jgi:hypothetical protein